MLRRHVGDYVGLGWVWATVILATPAVVAMAASSGSHAPESGWAWVYTGGALFAVTAVALGLRVVRDRAMAAPAGPERDLDESLRADGAHHLAGASVALAATCAAGAAWIALDSLPLVAASIQFVAWMSLGWWWDLARNARWSVRARRLAGT